MDVDANLQDQISTEQPEPATAASDIFAASRQQEEEDDSVDNSGIYALDLSTPSKQLNSTYFIPETPR